MADNFKIDTSELDQLAADLGTVPATAGRFIRSAVEVTSRNIKDTAAKSVGGRKHFGKAAGAIDYEVKTAQMFGVSLVDSEIGYNRDKGVGRLGNLVEYGAPASPTTGHAVAPTSDLRNALEANAADFEHGLDEALKDAEAVLRGDSSFTAGVAAVVRGSYR